MQFHVMKLRVGGLVRVLFADSQGNFVGCREWMDTTGDFLSSIHVEP